jgi:prepilin-type N-terminal cleavage/methylation domain-containing protein
MSGLIFYHPVDSQSRGFTVIELVAVITVMGILVASFGPRLWDNTTFNERGYTDEVAAAIRYSQTVATASECAVQFTLNAGGYSAMQASTLPTCNAASPLWSTQVEFSDGSAVTGTTAPEVTMTGPATVLTFNSKGQLPAGIPVVIQIGSSGVHTVTVQVPDGAVTIK